MNQHPQVYTGLEPCGLGVRMWHILRDKPQRPGSLAAYPGKEAGRDLESALGLLPLSRSALETLPDPGALSEKEGRLLLAALVKAYVQSKTNELEQETEDSR